MKKVVYIIAVFFTLSVISGVVLAKTETDYDKAVRYYNTGKYKEAVEIFKDYIKTKPEAPAYYRIGYALYELGDYAEANQYFQQAYLIDPSFSPDIVAPKINAEKIAKPPMEQAPPVTETQVPVITEIQPAPVPGPKPQMQMEPHRPQEQVAAPGQQPLPGKTEAVPAGEEAPSQEARVVTPQRVQPKPEFPAFPAPTEGMPTEIPGIPGGLGALMAGLGAIAIVMQIVSLALLILFLICLYIIAKKLNVPAPWLAFIPIINIWTIVSCAGKPWWWILLLLSPLLSIISLIVPPVGMILLIITSLLSIIVWIYLWMCISENLGKSKWLGLLNLIPNIGTTALAAILAFSKSETYGGPVEDITPA